MEKSFSVLAFFILLRDLIFLEVFFSGFSVQRQWDTNFKT